VSGISLLWGGRGVDPGIQPYPLRFESQAADGHIFVMPPEGTTEGPEPFETGRFFRAGMGTDPCQFFGRRSFGMNAGASRSSDGVPAAVPGRLLVTAFSDYSFRFDVVATCPFWSLTAALRISFDELDGTTMRRRVFMDDIVVAATQSAPIQFGGTSQRATSPRTGRVLNAEFNTNPGLSYRIWVDAMFRMVVHGPGVVRYNVLFPWVAARFYY